MKSPMVEVVTSAHLVQYRLALPSFLTSLHTRFSVLPLGPWPCFCSPNLKTSSGFRIFVPTLAKAAPYYPSLHSGDNFSKRLSSWTQCNCSPQTPSVLHFLTHTFLSVFLHRLHQHLKLPYSQTVHQSFPMGYKPLESSVCALYPPHLVSSKNNA